MTNLQNLLDQIDRLDQQATKGPWENTGDSIDSKATFEEVVTTEVDCSMYCYGGRGKGVQDDNDAEFIALARTVLPQLAKALQAVLDLRRMPDDTPEQFGYNLALNRVKQAITDQMEADDAG